MRSLLFCVSDTPKTALIYLKNGPNCCVRFNFGGRLNQFRPVEMIAWTTPGTHNPRISAQTVTNRLREIVERPPYTMRVIYAAFLFWPSICTVYVSNSMSFSTVCRQVRDFSADVGSVTSAPKFVDLNLQVVQRLL